MAKKQLKFKPTPAGILFLSAIAVLLIAIIVLIVFAFKNCDCKGDADTGDQAGDRANNPNETEPPLESETAEPSTAPLTGAWQTPEDPALTDELRALFTKAIEGREDDEAEYEPVELLGTQIVSGTNYCFLANKTLDGQTEQVKIFVNEDLAGSATVTDIIDAAQSVPGIDTPEPGTPSDPQTTPGSAESASPSSIVITTPAAGTATSAPSGAAASATPTIYTSPSKTQKKNAQKGYVSKDDVRMRKGPDTKYDIVKSDIKKNTPVTLYEEQNGWWFLQCDGKYGYIRADLITKGNPPSTPTPAASEDATGKVNVSKIALRKSASSKSECISEYENGEKLTIYWSEKDSDGEKWYYVKTSDGKKGYMFAKYVKITSGKVSSK